MTAWTTLRARTLASAVGSASLTEAVMMSPTRPYWPDDPPAMLMHEMRRAPELSATRRSVSIWIISGLRFRARQDRPLDDGADAPVLARRERPARDDHHDVPERALAALVVGHEL